VIDEETAGSAGDDPVEEAAEAASSEQQETLEQPAAAAEAPAEEAAAVAEAPAEEAAAAEPVAEADVPDEDEDEVEEEEEAAPREKPAIPGMDLEVDIVEEGADPLAREDGSDEHGSEDDDDLLDQQPITAAIELAADARYRATGKRKTAVARVILKPGTGVYTINGKTLDQFFPRATLQRTIRQPLETVGYEEKMDVIARMHGGGVSAQAGALRHGISRALLEADPNLRGELKRRGFLTRDARAKERKKAGLKKARKRPQFSKR
jgi:small subunit ribosomal protein S9